MKKIFLLTCLVVSAAIYSQELDEAYLQSLPESVREDVLNKIEAKDDLDKPVYRRASTFIDKEEDVTKKLFGLNFFGVIIHPFREILSSVLKLKNSFFVSEYSDNLFFNSPESFITRINLPFLLFNVI